MPSIIEERNALERYIRDAVAPREPVSTLRLLPGRMERDADLVRLRLSDERFGRPVDTDAALAAVRRRLTIEDPGTYAHALLEALVRCYGG